MELLQSEKSFGNVLLVGAGPAGIHVAVDVASGWCDLLGLLNREGAHTDQLKKELQQSEGRVSTLARVEACRHLVGEAKLSCFYEGFDAVEDLWDTIILCTPSDSYADVVEALRFDSLHRAKRLVLLSPGIGSNLLVQSRLGSAKERVEVISFSTYYAATKFESDSRLTPSINGIKRKIYVASNRRDSAFIPQMRLFIESRGVQCGAVDHPIEAESRSITTYVHAPLLLNEFSLHEIFKTTPSKKYIYKLYPEGPITQHVIRVYLQLWKEVSKLVGACGGNPFNLLKFLNDDNYPVHEVTLSREDIETFMEQEDVKQEYLLYIRYSSILIDPFSEPDEQGRYFDFSAFPYKQVYKDKNGKWVIPRIPLEDYKRLKLLHALGERLHVEMPQTAKLIGQFEAKLQAFIEQEGAEQFHAGLLADQAPHDAEIIWNELQAVTVR